MLIIYSIILISFIFDKYHSTSSYVPLRTDYYESFSIPVICLEISHNFPTGPLYLYSSFAYTRYSNISGKRVQEKFAIYDFKRVEKRCESSVIFTMLGNDFERLVIRTSIYMSTHFGLLAVFEYTFNKGFRSGIHGLIDIYNNFGMRVKVTNESKNYLGIPVSLTDDAVSYLISISKLKNDQLCVITENNHAIVLNPNFESNYLSGFIFGLKALILHNGIYTGERTYPAYACQKDVLYPDIDTIFITDGQNISIRFFVFYLSNYFDQINYFKNSLVYGIRKFNLSNPKFIDVHNIKNISRKYNKLFLIKIFKQVFLCDDGSWINLYFTENMTRYFVDAEKKIKILSAVEITRKINRSLEDPCGELENKD